MPLVAEAEIERCRGACGVGAGEIGLAFGFEKLDRPDVASAIAELPRWAGKETMGNAGVVFEDELAVGEEEIAGLGEASFVEEIGGRLEQARAPALAGTEGRPVRVTRGVAGAVPSKIREKALPRRRLWRFDPLVNTQAADGQFVDVQLANPRAADEDPADRDRPDREGADRQGAEGECAERLRADGECADAHGSEFDEGQRFLVSFAQRFHDEGVEGRLKQGRGGFNRLP